MKKVENFYGYDIYELSKEECRENYRVFPCLCAFCDNWDEYEDGVRTPNASECDFENLQEAKQWCKEYDRT